MSREGFAELLKILQFLSEFSLVAFLTNEKIWKRKSAINKEDNQLRYVDFGPFCVKFRKGVKFLEYIFLASFLKITTFFCFMISEKVKTAKIELKKI